PQLLFHILQATNLIPSHVRNLNQDLPHGGRLNLLQSVLKIRHLHNDLVQNIARDTLRLEIDLRQNPPQRPNSSLLRQRLEICTNKPISHISELLQINILRQRHSTCMNLQHLQPTITIRHSNLDLPVKPTWPTQRWIYRIRT